MTANETIECVIGKCTTLVTVNYITIHNEGTKIVHQQLVLQHVLIST